MLPADSGIAHIKSQHPVTDVLANLLSLLQTKSITVFAVVDHSGEAARVGIEMRDTKLVIFGNPRAGTPIMLAAPDSAIDLPLKILIAEGSDGTSTVSYNTSAYLQTRFGLAEDVMKGIAVVAEIAARIAA